jgi:hypothetical protein
MNPSNSSDVDVDDEFHDCVSDLGTLESLVYAVQFKGKHCEEDRRIFTSLQSALKKCTKDPDYRRFKVFSNFEEAYAFSYGGGKASNSLEQDAEANNCLDAGTNSKSTRNDIKPSLSFFAPIKSQIRELLSFIEHNQFESFREKVVENPRFLISHGDSPLILSLSLKFFFMLHMLLLF